jgi:uncharacterized protein
VGEPRLLRDSRPGGEVPAPVSFLGVVPRRLSALEERPGPDGMRVFVARSFAARLLGLAMLRDLSPDCGLLLPRCRSVHTFGMRFPIDIHFLDGTGRELRLEAAVPPNRFVSHRGAAAVLELRSPDAASPSSCRRVAT